MCPRQPGDDGTARQWPGARSVPGQPVTSPWAGRLRSGESRATHEGWGLSSRVWFWWLNAWVQWGPKKQSPKKAKHTSVFHRQIRDHRTNGAIKLTESGVGFPRSGRTAKRRGQWEAPALRLAVGGGAATRAHTPRTRHAHAAGEPRAQRCRQFVLCTPRGAGLRLRPPALAAIARPLAVAVDGSRTPPQPTLLVHERVREPTAHCPARPGRRPCLRAGADRAARRLCVPPPPERPTATLRFTANCFVI